MIAYDLLVLAFTTGVVVTVNPCGFAMLPAYLSFFVGVDADDPAAGAAPKLGRAAAVGGAVTIGFVGTFAAVGVVVNRLTDSVYEIAPWVSVVIGVVMAGLGVALVSGRKVTVSGPHLDRGGRSRGAGSMALFGMSYAIASIGCTLPLFVGTMSTMFGRSLSEGAQYFLAYSAGFGLVITALSMTLAAGKRSLASSLRQLLPFVHRVAGGLLVVTGAYIAYYGWVEIRSGQGRGVPQGGVISQVSSWSGAVSTWVQQQGGERVAVALALLVGAGATATRSAHRRTAAPR